MGVEVNLDSGGSIRMICDPDKKPDFLSALGMKLVNINSNESGMTFSFFDGEDQTSNVFVGSDSIADLELPCKFSSQNDEDDCSSDLDVDLLIERLKSIMSAATV